MKPTNHIIAACQARLHSRALKSRRRTLRQPNRLMRKWMHRNAVQWRARIDRLEDRLWAERDLHEATKRMLERVTKHRDNLANHMDFADQLHDAQVSRLGRITGYACACAMGMFIGFVILLTYLLAKVFL